jgi:hypothetical protein
MTRPDTVPAMICSSEYQVQLLDLESNNPYEGCNVTEKSDREPGFPTRKR